MVSGVGSDKLMCRIMSNKTRGLGTEVMTSVYDTSAVGSVEAAAVGGTESTLNLFHSSDCVCSGHCTGYGWASDYTPSDGSEDVHDKGWSTGIPVEDRVEINGPSCEV